MNPLPVVLASLRRFPLVSLATLLLVAVAVGLGTAVSLLEPSLRRGTTAAADKFDLLVGTPGSESQLVLSTVYLDGTSLPLLGGDIVESVAHDPGVAWFSSILLGDTWQKHPIVGVDQAFLEDAGRFIAPTDAFAGALVPLEPGREFHGTHGTAALSPTDVHETAYTVRGVLPPTGTPWDRAILVPASTVRAMHAYAGEEAHPSAAHSGDVSALVIKPRSVADAYRLRAALRTDRSMALFPAEVLLRLYDMLGDVQSLLTGMARLAQGAVLAGVLMAVFAGLPRRRATLAVLRALGAPRCYGALALWLEMALLLTLGGLLGLALGYGLTCGAARIFAQQTGVLAPVSLNAGALWTFVLSLGLGGMAALLPAVSCWHTPAAKVLRE